MTMRCEDVRDQLPALARGELAETDAAALREHVAACDECADDWAVVEALALATPVAPVRLADRVGTAIAQRKLVAPPRRRAARWVGGAGLATAALLALVIAWPERAPDEARTIALAQEQAAATDPFLDGEIFGATTPTEAELDGMVRVAALPQNDALPVPTEEVTAEDVPPLALDVGPALGDWPGADGMSAGMMVVDELTYDEMQILLEEMAT